MTGSVLFVIVGLLLIGIVAGFFMHRSDFCMAGAFRDLFLFRTTSMLRPLLLLVVVVALCYELESQLGLIVIPFPFFAPPTLFSFLGGIVFGVGMVLAGGCVIGVLYKLGNGNRLALTALLGLVVGSGLYAEVHRFVQPFVLRTRFTEAVTLPQWIGISSGWWVLLLAAVGGGCSWRWQRRGQLIRATKAEGYVQPWKTALLLAGLLALSSLLVGMPFGVTTAYLKWAALFEQSLWPEHVAQLVIYSAQPIAIALPFSAGILRGGAGPPLDAIALMQYPLIFGIVFGSTLSSWRLREWSWRGTVPPRQQVAAFAGGLLMAFGSRLTPGCNIWHLWGGVPIFALSSFLFLLGVLPGAWLGSHLIVRVVLGREGA